MLLIVVLRKIVKSQFVTMILNIETLKIRVSNDDFLYLEKKNYIDAYNILEWIVFLSFFFNKWIILDLNSNPAESNPLAVQSCASTMTINVNLVTLPDSFFSREAWFLCTIGPYICQRHSAFLPRGHKDWCQNHGDHNGHLIVYKSRVIFKLLSYITKFPKFYFLKLRN